MRSPCVPVLVEAGNGDARHRLPRGGGLATAQSKGICGADDAVAGPVACTVLSGRSAGRTGAKRRSMAVFAVGIVAFGQTLVICGGDGGIDLSVGAISGLAEVPTGMLISSRVPWPLAVLAGVMGGAVMGLMDGMAGRSCASRQLQR